MADPRSVAVPLKLEVLFNPKTATELSCVATNTLPLATVGATNFAAVPKLDPEFQISARVPASSARSVPACVDENVLEPTVTTQTMPFDPPFELPATWAAPGKENVFTFEASAVVTNALPVHVKL